MFEGFPTGPDIMICLLLALYLQYILPEDKKHIKDMILSKYIDKDFFIKEIFEYLPFEEQTEKAHNKIKLFYLSYQNCNILFLGESKFRVKLSKDSELTFAYTATTPIEIKKTVCHVLYNHLNHERKPKL